MYILASQLQTFTVMSLQTGEQIASVSRLLLSPANLELIGFYCNDASPDNPLPILLMRDIRQVAQGCLVVDSDHDITDGNDVVRLQEVLEANFNLKDKVVVTEAGQKLGKIQDFSINMTTNLVQKMDVKQPLFRNFMVDSLSIDREQIVDVTPRQIVVRDATVKKGSAAPLPVAD